MRGNKGFTLIEMIIALGVFVILMTSIAGVFLVVQRSQRTSLVKERLQTDARYILDTMVGDIRTGAPDYSVAPSPTTLNVKDEDGARILYQRATVGCPVGSASCILRQEGLVTAPITSAGVAVDAFTVIISPSVPAGMKQPMVTLFLTLSSNEGLPNPVKLSIQTSASSRVYGP